MWPCWSIQAGWLNRAHFDAIELLRSLEPFDVFWLEDFLHPEAYDAYAAVKAAGAARYVLPRVSKRQRRGAFAT